MRVTSNYMMKRTNLLLRKEDFAEAKRILAEKETTISAWMRLQIKNLIEQHRKRKSRATGESNRKDQQ